MNRVRFLVLSLLLAAGCTSSRPAAGRTFPASSGRAGRGSVPVVTQASVVAFWLAAADTIPSATRSAAREAFRESNAMVARYLDGTDIGLVATVNDTVVIQLAGGFRRTVLLSGLDFPYGYVLIEPGYAEEFHTGVDAEADLESAIDDYFGFGSSSPTPKHRIAQRLPEPPGPRIAFPGLAPVCAPSCTTRVPFTRTYLIPTESW
jgi:hypothetical protein